MRPSRVVPLTRQVPSCLHLSSSLHPPLTQQHRPSLSLPNPTPPPFHIHTHTRRAFSTDAAAAAAAAEGGKAGKKKRKKKGAAAAAAEGEMQQAAGEGEGAAAAAAGAMDQQQAEMPLTRYAVDVSSLHRGADEAVSDVRGIAREVATLSSGTLQQVLRQLVEEKTVDQDLWKALTGVDRASPERTLDDFFIMLEACRLKGYRDVDLIAALSDQLTPQLLHCSKATLLEYAEVYSLLGLLHEPVCLAIANALNQHITTGASLSVGECLTALRLMALQRCRQTPLVDNLWQAVVDKGELRGGDAVDLLYWHAYLTKATPDVIDTLQGCILREMDSLDLPQLSSYVMSLLLAEADVHDDPDVRAKAMHNMQTALERMCDGIFERESDRWASSKDDVLLHRRLLLIRSALRYLHRDTYEQLPDRVRQALRRVHRIELPRKPTKKIAFVEKLSMALTKLRIAHHKYATRGPLTFDILERDRKLVWECATVDRFYLSTFDKIATARLNERLTKAMGYRVARTNHWQWGRMKAKRSRIEYARMARYYALRDRREFEEYEGWTIPYLHYLHKKAKSVHHEGYFYNYIPMGHFKY
ncbi:unnamed protein product [Vitrella brassicaformis CCMP3155]|uniref:RAP domain-containing protein n=2 Tax=Vitrella brassicaformis TaxID=1169539 RepID=A0A0G4G059_VITBC|nr:unnamed protein product [Vitrella brassicaformis CCMP3155]|eukprot:CEM21236.1 unnamed protein product [Vitrella brassicaformis CCMP3155]